MTHPIVIRYCEGKETFTVDAAGCIGRPAINMAPSGSWLFMGVRIPRSGAALGYIELVERFQRDGALPKSMTVRDRDHGTYREHGRPVEWLRVEPGADVAMMRKIALERAASEQAALDRVLAERLAVARKAALRWTTEIEGVTIELREMPRKGPERFYVIADDVATEVMSPDQAWRELGATIFSITEG